MKSLRQVLSVLIANGLVVFLIAELNSALAPYSIYLTVAGALVVFPGLKLPLRAGLPAAALTGALGDAVLPSPPGLVLFSLCFLYAILHHFRVRFRVQRPAHFAVVACVSNLAYLLILTVWFLPAEGQALYGLRFLVEAALSVATVFLLSLWFFELQETALDLLGARPSSEENV
mgnify:CR=1 FL=1